MAAPVQSPPAFRHLTQLLDMSIRLLTVALLTSFVAAQSTVSRAVDDLLPASSYVAVRFAGISACADAADAMPLAQLAQTVFARMPETIRERVLADGLDRHVERLRHGLQRFELPAEDLCIVLRRPMALGVGRVTLRGMGPSVCLLIDGEGARDAINRAVRSVARLLPQFGINAEPERVEVAGHKLYRIGVAQGPQLFAGWLGDTWCISNSSGYLREVAAVQAGEAVGLNADTAVRGLRQKLDGAPLLSVAVHTATVMDSLAPHLPYEAVGLADALGLGRLDLIYGALAAGAHGGTDLLHVGVRGSEHGLFKALVAEPADLSFAEVCSENTVVFGACSFDVPAVVAAFQQVVACLPAEAQQEIRRELAREFGRGMRRSGTSPQEVQKLLGAFGNQVGVALSLEQGAVPKPELLVRLAVRDREVVASLLQRLEARVAREGGLEWRSRKLDERVVRYCNVAIEGKLQLSPCYVLDDDALWIGSDAAGLVRALRGGDPERSLAQQPDMVRLRRDCADTSGVLHVRGFRGVELGWRTAETSLLPMLDARKDELGFGREVVPDGEQVAAAVGTATFAWNVGDDGVTLRSDGPGNLGAWCAVLGAWADRVLRRSGATVF